MQSEMRHRSRVLTSDHLYFTMQFKNARNTSSVLYIPIWISSTKISSVLEVQRRYVKSEVHTFHSLYSQRNRCVKPCMYFWWMTTQTMRSFSYVMNVIYSQRKMTRNSFSSTTILQLREKPGKISVTSCAGSQKTDFVWKLFVLSSFSSRSNSGKICFTKFLIMDTIHALVSIV